MSISGFDIEPVQERGRQYVRMIVLSLLADVDLELRVCLGVVGLVLVLVVVVGEENVIWDLCM